MTHSLAERIAWYSTLVACCGGAAIIIAYCDESRPTTITARIIPVVELVRPDPFAEWQVETAVKACLEMAGKLCLKPPAWYLNEPCFERASDDCTVGNTTIGSLVNP